jgi:hypothetical protein
VPFSIRGGGCCGREGPTKSGIIVLMGYTSERLDNAVNLARKQGHTIAANGAHIGPDGQLHLTVDGHSLPVSELYAMVEPVEKDIFGFEARGHQYEIHVCYLNDGETVYQIFEDGGKFGEPQLLNKHVMSFVQQTVEDMGGSSLRRLL